MLWIAIFQVLEDITTFPIAVWLHQDIEGQGLLTFPCKSKSLDSQMRFCPVPSMPPFQLCVLTLLIHMVSGSERLTMVLKVNCIGHSVYTATVKPAFMLVMAVIWLAWGQPCSCRPLLTHALWVSLAHQDGLWWGCYFGLSLVPYLWWVCVHVSSGEANVTYEDTTLRSLLGQSRLKKRIGRKTLEAWKDILRREKGREEPWTRSCIGLLMFIRHL